MLELRQVCKSVTLQQGVSFTVLDDITVTIEEGELVCLLGPSGCGKTTFLRLVAGLEAPTSGEILVNGELVKCPGADRGLIFQDYALFPWRTVRGNLEFGPEVRGIPKKIRSDSIERFLDLFGLEQFGEAYPKELSGGMQQRVALARALINNPRLLLMDEPFGALDAQTRNDLQAFLVEVFNRTRNTIVFVTHNVDEAVFIGSRIIVMTKRPGRIGINRSIKLPYPRNRLAEEFIHIRGELLNWLSTQRDRTDTIGGGKLKEEV